MSRVLILSKHADEYRHLVEAADLPGMEKLAAAACPSEALALGDDFDVVFGEPSLIRDVLTSLRDLRWVQASWAGVEPLLDPTLRRDYLLTNARGVFGGLMSEFVFGYLLQHERRMFERYRAQQEGRWEASVTGTLRGKTLGLLGVGTIGAALAGTARHFGMTVRGYTRASESCPDVNAYYHGSRLLDFAVGLDYLVSVLPNTKETLRIVDASLLGRLPTHAVFVNVGRGSAVDESALVTALQTGKLAGAVLDVFEQEPLPTGHAFWHTPNLLMTFHTSAPSFPGDLAQLFIENYRRYADGRPPLHAVDFEKGY
ncbi:MAG TPA: D-2-hydroxyacid dehydrogenase [Anaerolineales bacterium]